MRQKQVAPVRFEVGGHMPASLDQQQILLWKRLSLYGSGHFCNIISAYL